MTAAARAVRGRAGGDQEGCRCRQIDTGDTAWVLVSAALVLFMTPGLALFYGGMVRAKNVLAMLMQNFFAMGIVTILWVLFGYSLAFGRSRRRRAGWATSTSSG